MLSGFINLYGVAFLLSSAAAFLWRERLKHTKADSLNKELWLKVLAYLGIFVFFLGSTFWVNNPIWFRTTMIIGHVFMIPAMYYLSQMWWRLLVGEMPKWWGWLVIGINLVFLSAEIYYAFKGYLPQAHVIRDNLTVLIRNDHPLVAWLFIPAVWTSFWPMGYVFMRQGVLADTIKMKVRLFAFGLAWILGSSMAVYSNFVVDPAKIYRGNMVLIVIFVMTIIAVSLKPKDKVDANGL